MKNNIDLTENQMFSATRVSNVLNIFVNIKSPWNIPIQEVRTNDDLDLDHQKNTIIIVGNKETREKIKFYRKMDSSDYCDCCGKRMNLIPWDIELGVCRSCDDYYSKDRDKCIWRKL